MLLIGNEMDRVKFYAINRYYSQGFLQAWSSFRYHNCWNSSNTTKFDILGLKVSENKDGVVISDIDTKSQAYKNNLRKNDIITEIGKKKINTIDEYLNELKNY